MASGRAHIAATITASAVILAAGVYFANPAAVHVAAGCAAGVFLTPDLDVDTSIRADRYLPSPLRWAWRSYWCPYALAIPHRHPLSHMPVLSTLVRVLYATWWLTVWRGWRWWHDVRMWRAFIGLAISDTLHWLMDGAP